MERPGSSRKTPTGSMVFDTTNSASSSESEEEKEKPLCRPESDEDLSVEYWHIQKLVDDLKKGDQEATVHTLDAMMDFNLTQEMCLLAIKENGGLEILLNLLDTVEVECQIRSLKILIRISHNGEILRAIVDMRGLQSIVKLLDSVKALKALAAETIANVAKFRKARRIIRQHGGIVKLVQVLQAVPNLANLATKKGRNVEVARCALLALRSCCKGTKNKEAICNAGGIPLLGYLLKCPHENMLITAVDILQECASVENCRTSIQKEGMIKHLVKNLSSAKEELQMHSASVIYKCAGDKQTCDTVPQFNGLQPLVLLLRKASNKQLLVSATGIIWKCSANLENVIKFQEYGALETLVGLLTDQPEDVLVNVLGALGEFAKIPANKVNIHRCGGIKLLIKLLRRTNQALLINVTKAVGSCAMDMTNMAVIDKLEGIRLLWSLLKNPNEEVQASAAWALCPCIERAKDAGETVRSLIGELGLILNLLKSTNNELLASVCAVITKIAKDKMNLQILTELGIVPLLANITNTTDERLRRYLSEAIGLCSMCRCNRASFGDSGAVAPLVRYLKSKDKSVHQRTAMALYQLSRNPNNIITMHAKGAVKHLILLNGSDDEMIQAYAACCTRNIRLVAQANRDERLYITDSQR